MLRRSLQAAARLVKYEPIKTLVGKDSYGNKYYEIPPQRYFLGMYSISRHKREVVPTEPEKYTRGGFEVELKVPLEWQSWLRKRRDDPPTAQEIENNLIKKQMVEKRVGHLEANQRQEKKPELKKKTEKETKDEQEVEPWTP